MKTKRNLLWIFLLAVVLYARTSGAQPVMQIAGRSSHRLILKGDGSLWNMDCYMDGTPLSETNQLQLIVSNGVTAVAAGRTHRLFLKNDGSLWGMGSIWGFEDIDINRPYQIVASGVIAIAEGGQHSLYLKSDGSLWAMGRNDHGELGDGTYSNSDVAKQIVAGNVTAIAAGGAHSLFLKSDGSLWGMGWNKAGELGDGTYIKTNQPEQIVAGGVTAVATGDGHSLFLKSDGSLWGMGKDNWGQLGDDTTHNGKYLTNRPEQIVASGVTAITAGLDCSMFLKGDGSLWATGWDKEGTMGQGFSFHTTRPVQILAANTWPIVAGYYYSPVLKNNVSIWASSFNNRNQVKSSGDTTSFVNKSGQFVANPSGYNLVTIELLNDSNVRLSLMGSAGTSYALDRSFSLAPPNWIPQATNPANSFGALVFTNTPDATTNNFWRIRSVP